MKLLEKLGVSTEAEALKVVDSFNTFTQQLTDMTGQEDPKAMVGVIAAWKAGASTAEQRKADEDKRAEATIAKLSSDGVSHVSADSLRTVYTEQGFAAFRDAADKAREEHTEARALIDGLVTEGRLQPAAKGDFQNLFASSGLPALKAAAAVLPAAKISTGAPPKAKPAETHGVESLTAEELWAAKITGKTPEEFAKAKAAQAAGN